MPAEVVVVGSLNRDLTLMAARRPAPGETVLADRHYWGYGGKGANQAVAAARLGARVAMVGMVGDDTNGDALISSLAAESIDVSAVDVDRHVPTGLAVITIDSAGENTIVVSAGANSTLAPEHVRRHSDEVRSAKVVLAQLEVPIEAVAAATEIASGVVCLNPAPAADLSPDLLARVDVLIPNRTELGRLARTPTPASTEEATTAVARLDCDVAVVVTLGSDGALVVENGRANHFPAPHVEVVDPTGAGDAFCGALAESLSRDASLGDAVGRAVAAGALAATRPGAQSAMPTVVELEQILSR